MASAATLYQFDPSGAAAANRITNEQHVLTAQNFRDYHYVVPKFAPFFEKSFSIKLQYPNGEIRPLILGIDYYFANQFLDASRACAKPVYGSISFLDTDTAGILSISYNTVGGIWNITPQEISRILAEEMRNPRTTSWEQITYLPERFPVIDHEWDLVDMVGASEVVESIEHVRQAILTTNTGGMSDHVTDYANPHQTNKAQIGLPNVEDYPIATAAIAQDGTSNVHYMTPLRTRDAINALVNNIMVGHAGDINNPHQVTKVQVGLGNVQNYTIAAQADAVAGIKNDVYMTPLRTAQAIAATIGTDISSHFQDQQNPHNTTKAQVGLSQVQNFAIASQQEALDGTADDKYMTPRRTKQLAQAVLQASVGSAISDHVAATDNPHNTNKFQIGLGQVENYPVANLDQALAGVMNAAYMTPGLVKQSILEFATPKAHLADKNNPHEVTPAQLGVYTTGEVDVAMQLIFNEFPKYVQKTDEWVAGMPAEDFIAITRDGTVRNALSLNGLGVADIVSQSAATKSLESVDVATVEDPIATPDRWILLGKVSGKFVNQYEETSAIETTHPDAYWFMAGGHQQEATPAENAAASSPAYMIHAKNGLMNGLHNVEVVRLSGAINSNVQFGYTFDSDTNTLYVWLKTTAGYNDISISRLTSLGNSLLLSDDDVFEEPEDIVYVTPISYATSTEVTDLKTRVQFLETVISSVLVV